MWDSSQRRSELPPDWFRLRSQVLRDAGNKCQIRSPGCAEFATDVDHIRRGNDHRVENLRAACSSCHLKKSSAEGNSRKRELRALKKRPLEKHPGLTRRA
jgi:5-methylcytosine-specific restriction endonuclease McrA